MDKKKIIGNDVCIICSIFVIVVCGASLIGDIVYNHEAGIIWIIMLLVGICNLLICMDDKKKKNNQEDK